MKTTKNVLATIGLFILYLIYRVSMLPFLNDTIMTFSYWSKYATKNDWFKVISVNLAFFGWWIFGFWWMISISVFLFLLNHLINFVYLRIKNRKS